MNWPQYVARMSGGETQAAIGHKIGVSSATVSRWSTFAPKPENVAAFARAYDRPVLEAFIAAGFLTAEEAAIRPAGRVDPGVLSNDELLDEVRNRMKADPPPVQRHVEDATLPSDYYGLAAHPRFETEHEKFEKLHGDAGEENQEHH
jgi:transcriptional regulator with XRE-family HTH domain